MANNKILMVQSVPVTIIKQSDTDFISLTDMVRDSESGSAVIDNWLRNKNTLEFLSVWEEIYNPAFNSLEFEEIKKVAGLNRFTMSVKQWITPKRDTPCTRLGANPACPASPGMSWKTSIGISNMRLDYRHGASHCPGGGRQSTSASGFCF